MLLCLKNRTLINPAGVEWMSSNLYMHLLVPASEVGRRLVLAHRGQLAWSVSVIIRVLFLLQNSKVLHVHASLCDILGPIPRVFQGLRLGPTASQRYPARWTSWAPLGPRGYP